MIEHHDNEQSATSLSFPQKTKLKKPFSLKVRAEPTSLKLQKIVKPMKN